MERKERQVDELSIKGAELTQQLAQRESEVSTYVQRAARLELEVSRFSGRADAPQASAQGTRSSFDGEQILLSPDDEEEHLGNATTLAALRQRLYQQYDGVVADASERFAPVGPRHATAGTGGCSATIRVGSPLAAQQLQQDTSRTTQQSVASSSWDPGTPVQTTIRLHTPQRGAVSWGTS
uniref:Uncharacterized protein n=1 Tax=Pyrodinium bahamense TaxID=73915 RepID=A0A7S0A9R3_9DINO